MPETHVTLRLKDDTVFATSRAARLHIARAVLRVCKGEHLIVFNCADTHLHLLLGCEQAAAGRKARALEISLRRNLIKGVNFQEATLTPITDQTHFRRAFFYILDQRNHHGLDPDPFFEASNLPDLVGLRVTGSFTRRNVRGYMQRLQSPQIWDRLGGPPPKLSRLPLQFLAEAAASAACAPDLLGTSEELLEAKRAAVHLALSEHPQAGVAKALSLHRHTIERLAAGAPRAELSAAIRLQLAFRNRLARSTVLVEAQNVDRAF